MERGSAVYCPTLFTAAFTSSLKDVMLKQASRKQPDQVHISLINDKAMDHHTALSIQLRGRNAHSNPSHLISWDGYSQALFDNAVKYQILNYLLYHQQFLAHQLAQDWWSVKQPGRHISGLNQILSEFELFIQNGRLKGPEHNPLFLFLPLFVRSVQPRLGKGTSKSERRQKLPP